MRDILKNFRVPRELARSPLAQGSSVQERAESVQRLVRQAADEAFGDSETEKLLRSVLIAGYLEPLRSHEEAASKLRTSRAAPLQAKNRRRAAGRAHGGCTTGK